MIKNIILAAVLAVGSSGAGQAATYNVSMSGAALDFTAQIVTNVSNLVTGITGWVGGTDAITGMVSLTDSAYQGVVWNYNNIFGSSAPWVDNSGILFKTASGVVFNIFTDAGGTIESFAPSTGSNYNPGTYGTLSVSEVPAVSAVPVPAAGVLLLSALGGAAALRRRKAKAA